MLDNIPKISVLVISYNQERYISRAIESLLSQKDYIYEICVSDDSSKDKTWEILQDYDRRYPGLFKLNRNEHNVGIFENIEKTWEMPTGEIISRLSGDDECGNDWYRHIIEFIKNEEIDYHKELFCIYGDYQCIYPNGDCYVYKNKNVNYNSDYLSLAIRQIIRSNRATCYSKQVLDKFKKVSRGRSHIAEFIQDRQLQIYTKNNYYIHQIGNVYYTGLGVSSKRDLLYYEDREQIIPYALNCLDKFGVEICKADYSIRRYLFAFFRRIPHNKPLLWV